MKDRVKYAQPPYLPLGGLEIDANVFTREKSEAEYCLGQLQSSGGDGLGKAFFNAELLVSPLVTKEAIMSSKIEGTISTVSDVYKYDAGQTPKHSGTKEVWNYRGAIEDAMQLVQSGRRMNKTYVKAIHKKLLTGVRHKGTLGDFRKKDVWIGEKQNDPIEKAIYVPPVPVAVESYMDNIFEYMEKGVEDPLTKAALVHYQFEAVHPFEDGNGRVGRLLIPLILFENKRILFPILYMSGYFDECRDEYRDALHSTDISLKYEAWLKFFFASVSAQAKETLELIRKINGLHGRIEGAVKDYKSPFVLPFLAYMFKQPVFYPSLVEAALGTTYIPVSRLIKLFEERGILSKSRNKEDKRMRVYTFNALIRLLSDI